MGHEIRKGPRGALFLSRSCWSLSGALIVLIVENNLQNTLKNPFSSTISIGAQFITNRIHCLELILHIFIRRWLKWGQKGGQFLTLKFLYVGGKNGL